MAQPMGVATAHHLSFRQLVVNARELYDDIRLMPSAEAVRRIDMALVHERVDARRAEREVSAKALRDRAAVLDLHARCAEADTLREMARLILHPPAEARPMGRRAGRSLERES